MSLTISELESERAKILDEIESKAKTISQTNSSIPSSSNGPHTLNDWLNAAEEIMPETNKPKSNYSNKASKSLHSNRVNNKASFFGVVIMLSLFLTILGVLYIAYTSIHKELQTVMAVKDENIEQMKQLQADMQSLQQAFAAGGKSELFSQLERKVTDLETQVTALQAQIASGVNPAIMPAENDTNAVQSAPQSAVGSDKVVTEAMLDQKLQQIESKIDLKLEAILQHLTQSSGLSIKSDNLPIQDKTNKKELVEKNISNDITSELAIETPVVADIQPPVIEAPLLKLVSEVKQPLAPKAPDEPIANATADVKWILEQPKQHYILQLASMPEVSSLNKIVDSKDLKETKILPQTRGDITNYVLVTGSFMSRDEANKLAKKIKTQTGVSPWVRKVKDLTERLQ